MQQDKIINLLACPNCKTKILKKNEILICETCNLTFEIYNNIPIMLNKKQQIEIKANLENKSALEMIDDYESKGFYSFIKPKFKKIFTSSLHLNTDQPMKLMVTNKNKLILNIGSGTKKLGDNVLNIDIGIFPNVNVVGDGSIMPFQDNSFDGVLNIAVLEHVKNPKEVIKEMYRVLKKGGEIYVEIPFLQHYHGYPSDYQRYTLQGIENLFSDFKKIESGVCVGPSSALLAIFSEWVTLFSFTNNKYIYAILKAFALVIAFPIKYLDYILSKNPESHKIAFGLFFYGIKSDY